jgi:hypothetical protein
MTDCLDADKTHFLKFALVTRQLLISGANLENKEVKILVTLKT